MRFDVMMQGSHSEDAEEKRTKDLFCLSVDLFLSADLFVSFVSSHSVLLRTLLTSLSFQIFILSFLWMFDR